VVFLACVHLALFRPLSLFPGNSLVSSCFDGVYQFPLYFSFVKNPLICEIVDSLSLFMRLGGRADRPSCLPGLRRRGGGHANGVQTLRPIELEGRRTIAWDEVSAHRRDCLRDRRCAQRRADTEERTLQYTVKDCRADSVHTAALDTTKLSRLCRLWRVGVN